MIRKFHDRHRYQDERRTGRTTELARPDSLLVGRFVLSPDPDYNVPSCFLVNFVENPVIPSHPDTELVFPSGYFIVTSRARVPLEVQDGSGHPKKILVIQFEQLTFRGAPEPDLKHVAS